MEEDTSTRSMPGIMLATGPIILIVAVVLFLRSRRKSKDERAFSRIVNTIDDSALPDRAKEILRQRVDEVRGAMSAIREMASEIRSD
ncbi:MAG: hypothetical protein M3439_08945 [Chloroflexota bacterium]|nr:hypothetical protein [Chloroflexota bacterium]